MSDYGIFFPISNVLSNTGCWFVIVYRRILVLCYFVDILFNGCYVSGVTPISSLFGPTSNSYM